jgi:hypothetical protein
MASLLLIYPPVAKNCEPPAGIARLAGFLRGNGVSCITLDANRLGFDYLLNLPCGKSDTWSQRAVKNVTANRAGLQESRTYTGFDRYKRMVSDVNRVLSCVGEEQGLDLSLVNYQDANFSPVQSEDLCRAAGMYQDNIFYPFYVDCLTPVLERRFPDYIGISITYLSQAVAGFALIGFLRQQFPAIKIILGGGLVTSWMRSPLWQNPFKHLVDICIAGPGEQPLFELLSRNEKKPGFFPPVYDETDYLAPGFILPYGASSGCYWNKCLFCPETAEENPYIPLPVTQVMADLDILAAQYKPRLIHFLDNAVSPALMTALTEKNYGIPWYGFARICSQLADEDFCYVLRRSGCVMLKLGLESGDQHVLDAMHKGIELSLAARVLKALKAAGILTYVYLLFGTPSEDEVSARRTLDFTIQHHEEIGFLNLAVFNLPLGGPEAAHLVVNEFYSGDLSLYTDFVHPKGWSRRKVRSFLNRDFKRHPAILAILQRDPPLFTSNHAPLFHPSFQRL